MQKVSPQRKWQIKQRKLNRCVICSRPSTHGQLCEKHAVAHRVKQRERTHCSPRVLCGIAYDQRKRYEAKRREIANAYGKKLMPSITVAKQYGVSQGTVLRLARTYGYPIGKRGERR